MSEFNNIGIGDDTENITFCEADISELNNIEMYDDTEQITIYINGESEKEWVLSQDYLTPKDIEGKADINSLKEVAFSGDYRDLINKPIIGGDYELPTASRFEKGGIKIDGTTVKVNNEVLSVDAAALSYEDLQDKPSIPTDVSELNNDSGYVTDKYHDATKQDLISAANKLSYDLIDNKPSIPTKTSDLTNDSNFLTSHQQLKTINGTSLVGTGDIEIEADEYTLPEATASTLGGIKVDDETIKVNAGIISVNEDVIASKEFVNSSIATNTANFRGTYDSVAELQAYAGVKTINDYAFVVTYDSTQTQQIKEYDRYKFNGTSWVYEYTLNNSSFTQSQWDAINSGVTAAYIANEAERLVYENYNNSKAYKVGNKVVYNDSSYYCKTNTTAGTLPTNTSYWIKMAGKGADGEKGDAGSAATISIGTVSTGNAGTLANVTNSGSSSNAVFNFTIPKGETGASGEDGFSPVISTTKTGRKTTVTVVDKNGSQDFEIFDGIDGSDSGDMFKSVYDTHNKNQDIFDYVDNHVDTSLSGRVSDLEEEIEDKVDKVTGKGLSTNDYTTSEKTKLAGLENYDDSAIVGRIETLEDDIQDKVDKIAGKGLSTEDYTTAEKTKLAGLSNYDDSTLSGKITTIEGKIPSSATSSNQLADKSFVNSSIATSTAFYLGSFNSFAELQAYSGEKTNNDYAYVKETDSLGQEYIDRYKWNSNNNSWLLEYKVNNTTFTAAQLAAINSGITSTDKDVIDNLSTVATSGSYNDLSNKPNLSVYATAASLSTVATSGSYDDLSNKPTIPAAYTLPNATTSTLGGVKPDGTTITVSNGVISAVQPETVTVVDNLTSTSTTSALSAKQGKTLNDALVSQLNGYTIWVGTQSQFNAISNKLNTTIYIVKED